MTARRAPMLLFALAWAGSAAAGGGRIALVALQPLSEAQLAELRAHFEGERTWLDDPAVRRVLEGFDRAPPPSQRIRGALAQAHERMRRFDLPGVRQVLDDAISAGERLAPTAEGRALAVDIALQEAELALVKHDAAGLQRALDFALSASPGLRVDASRYPPSLAAALEHARAAEPTRHLVSVNVETSPPGAAVALDGRHAGPTPLTLDDVPEGPHLLWVEVEGFVPRAARILAEPELRVRLALEPAPQEDRLGPFVDAVRQTEGDRRRAAAEALATVLGVDAIAVAPGGTTLATVYERAPQAPLALVAPPSAAEVTARPWYRDGWGDVLGGAAALSLGGGAASLAVAQRQAVLANEAPTYDLYLQRAHTAGVLRPVGGAAVAVGSALLVGAIVRYAWAAAH